MKPRTMGKTSSYIQQAADEIHSAEWAKRVVQYLSDCDLHKKKCVERGIPLPVYKHPLQCPSLPLASWFETVHGIEVTRNLTAMRGIITSVYGRVLKVDSTKKLFTDQSQEFVSLGVVCNFCMYTKTRYVHGNVLSHGTPLMQLSVEEFKHHAMSFNKIDGTLNAP